MPIAEAMASGTPVITSDCASMPEVAKNTAKLINPNDINQITIALDELIHDPKLRNQMSLAGIKQSNFYTWDRSSEALITLLQNIHKRSF